MSISDLAKTLQTRPAFIGQPVPLTLDTSGMQIDEGSLKLLEEKLPKAHKEMERIEAGEIKNPNEHRKVTHFTDRQDYLSSELFKDVLDFAEAVRNNKEFDAVIINGIGGSALGPQLLQQAIRGPYWNELSAKARKGYPRIYFLDNTDPAGVHDVLSVTAPEETLVVSISKSGGTQETQNNIKALEAAFEKATVSFAEHAVAVTMSGSKLDQYAKVNKWLRRFPMAESIGGRTSETNIVGHVPAALAGIDFRDFLKGATSMDNATREGDPCNNPAYQLAISWYVAGNGKGERNMVMVPYSDRLVLLGKYLQQLVMESLGKEKDLDGNRVCQGLTVYGNKGGTDAHAYIQQLNDGPDDFFITFIESMTDVADYEVSNGFTMSDYLHGFKEGLRHALLNKNRRVIDLTINEISTFTVGQLIALYERAVAFYAELININAFHQPGVENYKNASRSLCALNEEIRNWISSLDSEFIGTAEDILKTLSTDASAEDVEGVMMKFAFNGRKLQGKRVKTSRPADSDTWRFTISD